MRIGGEVKGWDPSRWIDKKKNKEMDRFTEFAVGAAAMAVADAKLELTDAARERAGCFVGVGLCGLFTLEKTKETVMTKGSGKVSPYSIPGIIANLAAGQVAIAQGLKGPSYCTTSACSSGAHAIGEASEWIRRGKVDVMVAGGTEATITPVGIAGFEAMLALSKRNDDPQHASRPFDKGRDGFVCGEGSGILVLESLTHAKKRGATIYAEVTGYGASRDAYHLTQPAPEHEGAQRAMRMALEDARVSPDAIDYVNAHGTSTPIGDVEESRAVAAVFGVERDRQEAVGELHQVDDGAPPRRGRRGRVGGLRARHRARATSRRPSTSSTPTPSARSTTSPTRRASGACGTP